MKSFEVCACIVEDACTCNVANCLMQTFIAGQSKVHQLHLLGWLCFWRRLRLSCNTEMLIGWRQKHSAFQVRLLLITAAHIAACGEVAGC